jgi:ferredoxin-NADP reductase
LVSNFLHDHINEGDLIDVQAPSGEFFLDPDQDTPVALLAGGVGVTPILSMCNSLIDRKSTREVWIFFGVRHPDDLVMLPNFEYAASHLKNAHVYICFSGSMPEGVEDCAVMESGIVYKKGRVDCAMLKATMPGNNYGYYICGPEVMMTTLDKDLQAWGVPKDKINWEAFGETAAPAPAAVAPGQSLTVTYGQSGKSITWQGEKSIRATAKANKFKEKRIKYACGQGKCGCCHTALKRGEVHYPDVQPAFAGLQEGCCLPCIAVPKTEIELDA